jgi:hypothetical protein
MHGRVAGSHHHLQESFPRFEWVALQPVTFTPGTYGACRQAEG